jgi:hypothetical protein
MRPSSYIIGMFGFDMLVSTASGIIMIAFAVQTQLSQFKGAPVSLLVIIVILSAFALNAGALLMVKVLGKKSSVLPMVAPCLSVAATAATSLLNVFVYTDDGDWPWYLSTVPFLAQGRALYIVLVYHKTSAEVDTALSLLALFGAISLVTVYILEADIPVVAIIRHRLKAMTASDTLGYDTSAIEATELNPQFSTVNSTLYQFKNTTADGLPVDDDVAEEMRKALAFHPPVLPPRSFGAQPPPLSLDTPAIVIQALRHVWPNGTVGVEELSLTMAYGECFGKFAVDVQLLFTTTVPSQHIQLPIVILLVVLTCRDCYCCTQVFSAPMALANPPPFQFSRELCDRPADRSSWQAATSRWMHLPFTAMWASALSLMSSGTILPLKNTSRFRRGREECCPTACRPRFRRLQWQWVWMEMASIPRPDNSLAA